LPKSLPGRVLEFALHLLSRDRENVTAKLRIPHVFLIAGRLLIE
jgi:hypothetical protein